MSNQFPDSLLIFLVAKITRRFGVSPVKVRARMAQKCKDLRRLMRNKNGEMVEESEGITTPLPTVPSRVTDVNRDRESM